MTYTWNSRHFSTKAAIARASGKTWETVNNHFKRYGHFRWLTGGGPRPNRLDDRNDRIVAMRNTGATYEQIARRFGISKSRAHRIVQLHGGGKYPQ